MAASSELLLLSAVCRTKDHKTLTVTGITPEMFHEFPEEGKWLFKHITRHGKAPSKGALRNEFPGITIYAVDDVEFYSEAVRKEHAQNALMVMMDEVIQCIEEDDMDGALQTTRMGLQEVQSRQHGVSANYDVFEDWESTYSEVARRVDTVRKHGMAGIPTGFPSLDNVTGGFQPGWYCVWAARLGGAKTMSAIKIAFTASCAGKSVEFWSLEQGRHQIGMRLHGFAATKFGQYTFNSMDLNRGTGFDLLKYKKFLREMKGQISEGGKFTINDSSRGTVTPQVIGASIERNQPDFVVIDYLTLLASKGEDWRATASMSAEIQGLCQRYNIPILGLSQINRSGAGKEPPGAEGLAQSDAIGQDADLVITSAAQTDHVLKAKIAKFRHGPGGLTWYSHFDPGRGRYEEISGDQAARLMEKDREAKDED